VTLSRIAPLLVFAALSSFPIKAATQDLQETFEKELIAACNQNDQPAVDNLIREHRLWVKPVVNKLISEYIELQLNGDEAAASKKKHCTSLIANSFQQIFGEKSLAIGVGYLDGWNREKLEQKQKADSLYALATDLRIGGDQPDEAIKTFHAALELYSKLGDVRGQGEVLGGLGYMYFTVDPDTSLYYYEKALQAREQVDDKYLTGGTLNTIGLIYYYYTTELDTPISYFNRAAEIREEIRHWQGLGSTLLILGEAYQYKGELDSAIYAFEKSYLSFEKAGNSARMAEGKLHSGTLLIRTGKYPPALDNLSTSLDLYQILGDTMMMGDVHTQFAIAYAYLGDYDSAIEHATRAFELYEGINEYWGLAGAYNHTGIVLQEVKRTEKALEYYEKALAIYKELNDQEHVVIISNNLGTVEFDLRNYSSAEEYHSQALKISQQMQDKSLEMPSLLNLANTQNMLGKLDEAQNHYESALMLSKELENPETEWKIMMGMAELFQRKGDFTKAIEYNEAGLQIIEQIRASIPQEEFRTSYMARERYAYEDVIHMLGELYENNSNGGYEQLAFQYVQRSKSRTFLDFISQNDTENSGTTSQVVSTPATLAEVKSTIEDRNTVLLEYSLGDSSSYVWIITKENHWFIKLPARETLQEQIETLRFALLDPQQDNLDFFINSGYSLYNKLISPAEKYLSKKSSLIILPDGILHYLPFQALLTKELSSSQKISYTSLPYLTNDYPISYGQSASVLVNLMEHQAQAKDDNQHSHNLLAFGDPVYESAGSEAQIDRNSLNRLVHSGNEVKEIAKMFPDGSSRVYLREEALEENFKNNPELSFFKYIHFATHGLIDEENPENSSIVLSQGGESEEDELLKAEEIAQSRLQADLVVLSACRSGLGKMVRGEGIIGLTRAFMFAGSPSVVASLWNVSDASTTILMQRFYANLLQKNLSKTEALQQAQISMISEGQYAHPFFWAPFILIGGWR
jgi:CHAT domain-containing protein